VKIGAWVIRVFFRRGAERQSLCELGSVFQMWACAKGHQETAILLYRWNHTALNVRNLSAQTSTDCARSNKHEELAQEMERLEAAREKNNMTLIGKALNFCSVEVSQVFQVEMATHSC
jgi:hypothetical protein